MEKGASSPALIKNLLIGALFVCLFLAVFGWVPAMIFGGGEGMRLYGAYVSAVCLAAPVFASFFLFARETGTPMKIGVTVSIIFGQAFLYGLFGQAGSLNLAPAFRRLLCPAGFQDALHLDFQPARDDFFVGYIGRGLLGEIRLDPALVFLVAVIALVLYTILIMAFSYGATRLAGRISFRSAAAQRLFPHISRAGALCVLSLLVFFFLRHENSNQAAVFPALNRLLYPGQSGSLIEAVRRGKLDFAGKLIKEGADILGKNGTGETALGVAGKIGNKEALSLLTGELSKTRPGAESLFRRGYIFTEDDFIRAVQTDDREATALFVKNGIRLNPGGGVDSYCPFWHALVNDRVAVAELLLAGGARLNACGSHTQYLAMAAEKNQEGMIELLLENGADVNAVDPSGRSALLAASQAGRANLVSLLLDNGADPGFRNKNDENAALLAAMNLTHSPKAGEDNPYFQIIRRLGEKGADLDLQNKQGWTILMYAASHGHVPLVKYLLGKGVSVNLYLFEASASGNNALQMARHAKRMDVAALLTAAGAKD